LPGYIADYHLRNNGKKAESYDANTGMLQSIAEKRMNKKLNAEHGVVCRMPGESLGYFGWPTVARLPDGTLMVVSSGLRSQHVCPWGKGVLNVSADDGLTWSPPRVIHDTPLDDRDGGIVSLGGQKLLVAWFTEDTRPYADADGWWRGLIGDEEMKRWHETMDAWTDATMKQWLGSWVALSDDGGQTWSEPRRVPVNSPHGPILLRSGSLIYLGTRFVHGDRPDPRHPQRRRRKDLGGHGRIADHAGHLQRVLP
jgi:hypothetical protein